MEVMPIRVSQFNGNYDTRTRSLTIEIVQCVIFNTAFDETNLKIMLTFDAEKTWLIGEMIDTLKKRSSYGFGNEPKLGKDEIHPPDLQG